MNKKDNFSKFMLEQNNNKVYLMIIVVLTILLTILLGLHILRDYVLKDNESPKEEKIEEKEPTKEESKENQKEEPTKEILWTNIDENNKDGYEVSLQDKTILINDREIAHNVKEYYNVKVGTDICLGDSYIIILNEDTTIGALSLDQLECGNTIKYKKNINKLKNITRVYEEINEEALSYGHEINDIYVDTKEESKIKITDYLK